jgi:hypothetical protein
LEVIGLIESLSGSCPDLALRIAGTTLVTDRRTNFKQMSCAALGTGQSVVARGKRQPNGEIRATKIERK